MDSLKNIIGSFLQGIYDSVRGIFVIFYLDREINKKLAKNQSAANLEISSTTKSPQQSVNKEIKREGINYKLFQCCTLNGGIFLLSILFFDMMLLPFLKHVITYFVGSSVIWDFVQFTLSRIFEVIWVLPLFLLSKLINSLWFQDIADSAYKFRKGRPTLIPNVSKLIADVLFSLLVQALFLFQSMLVTFIPYIGTALSFVHICLLYSLYSFEYKWFNMGLELHKRLTFIEFNWPYFFGFGFLLAASTQMCQSYFISGCVFSILFPLFILSGNESTPKLDSCEYPLRLFSIVVTISNALFSKTVKRQTQMRQK